MFTATVTAMLGLNQDLLAERLKGPSQKKWSRGDKILAGYAAYTERVRYRLFPFLW